MPTAPAALPLDLQCIVGGAAWGRLPAAVQRRFAAGHALAAYTGALDVHCSLAGRWFAACTRLLGGPLTGLHRDGVPATVRVFPSTCGGVVWERHLHLDAQCTRVVRSTKLAGADGALVERTDGGIAMELDVFEEAGALVFRSRRYFVAIGRWRLPLPALLTPGTCRVEHRDLGDHRFLFTLSMDHAWWGRTFHQSGVFADPEGS